MPNSRRRARQPVYVFIGPPAAAIRSMGSKTAARRSPSRRERPSCPGPKRRSTRLPRRRRVADQLGYPVLLKAAAGGGGKGMRRVDREADLEAALRDASSEALRAFRNGGSLSRKASASSRGISRFRCWGTSTAI